jgi:hypothetical protein
MDDLRKELANARGEVSSIVASISRMLDLAKASYRLQVDVRRVHDLLGGEFEVMIELPGKPDTAKRGALRGGCEPLKDEIR